MKWIPLTLLVFTGACASTQTPSSGTATSESTQTTNLAGYHTFSFGSSDPPRPGYEVSSHSLDVQQHLMPLVEAAFTERGYARSAEGADFVVKIASGTAPPTPAAGERIDSLRGPQGFIGIDVYDKATGTEVWQGTAFAEIAMDKIDDDLLRRGVAHMLSTFPRQGGASDPRQRLGALQPTSSN